MSYFLSCDPLQSNECTVGDYVIEWRLDARDGTVVFVSGEGADTDIQAQHPFVDEVVFAGTLYPIIRYAYLNGDKYTSTFEEGAYYSPDFITCLDPVVVEEADCNTVLGTDPDYNYYLSYNNVLDVGSDKSRTIKYNISPTTQYLAWRFRAYEVAEQIKIYYCTEADPTGTLIDNFIIGERNGSGGSLVTNLYPVNYPTDYRTYYLSQYSLFYFISDFTDFTYTAGDYIKIQIVGSVLEPSNINTNWIIALQCFDSIDDSFYSTDVSKIDGTPTMSYSSDPGCYYNLTYNTLETLDPVTKNLNPYFLYKYTNLTLVSAYTPVTNSAGTNPVNNALFWTTSTSGQWLYFPPSGYNICNNLSPDSVTIARVSNEFSFTFSNITQYNEFVTNISNLQASANYTTWLGLTDSDTRYYGGYYIRHRVAASCGDAYTDNYIVIWVGSTIEYDEPNKTVTFVMTVPTNNIVDEDCDSGYESVNSRINLFNTALNFSVTPANQTTYVKFTSNVAALWDVQYSSEETTRDIYVYLQIHEVLINNIFDPLTLGFCYNSSTKYYLFYRADDRLTLKTYATHDQRLNDWKLERKIRLRTDDCADDTYEIVAEGPGTTTTTTTVAPTTTTTSTTVEPTTTTTTTTP